MAKGREGDGVSLAKGPVGVIRVALLAYGSTGLIFGGHHFVQQAVSGTQNGKTWLGLEGNGWTNLLFVGAGALLLFGAPLHWGAKTLSLIVGLALGAASLIAIVDGHGVFGIFAANGLTELVWGVAAAVLIVLALLPRVGGKQAGDDDARAARVRCEWSSVSRPVSASPGSSATHPRPTTLRSRRRGGSVVAGTSETAPDRPRPARNATVSSRPLDVAAPDHMRSIMETFRALREQRRRRRASLPWAELEAEAARQGCSAVDVFFDRAGRSVPGLPVVDGAAPAPAAELAPIPPPTRAGDARKPTYDTWGRRT